ncbi:serine hydrolase domain-containing protein [Nocardia cyriacigeorgica]|uniref:Esterase estB n=1 Tax=Nocardia cyriacigeorgica TaxID=135487 RepID=A0A4U8W9Y9_9NOCA|nr:serine hydrolase domain-containing protein [Nocardia cyriacigeorgica]TLF55049.1 beta-lactamase family protein [Nocardia cyriacigeorgica]VFA99147.1 Esterase estB [Nocardia cyriacigeorgica]
MSVSTRYKRRQGPWAALATVLILVAACGTDEGTGSDTTAGASSPAATKITDLMHDAMGELDLTAAVFGVWRGAEQVVLGALGDSPLGVPTTADMRLRVGQPMEPMLSTVLWRLDGQGVLSLDEPIARWMPEFPRADAITPRMLADSTSGIADYVTEPEFLKVFGDNPFSTWTAGELLARANARPPLFAPGTSFAYAHSDLVVLGEVLQKATGTPLGDLIAEHILDPLGMGASEVVLTPQIEGPILHGYTNERNIFEDSTFWNPTAFLHSGNMTSTVADVGRWVRALGTGELLTDDQFRQMMEPSTAGLGPLTREKYFAFGVVHLGDWLFMNPSYGGYDGVAYYDTTTETTVVAYVTLGPNSDANRNNAVDVGRQIAAQLVPDRPPPAL